LGLINESNFEIAKSLNQKSVFPCGRRSLIGYVVQRMQLNPVFHSLCDKLFYRSLKHRQRVRAFTNIAVLEVCYILWGR